MRFCVWLDTEVAVAPDGIQALAMTRSFEVEVALLDIGLPAMDGYELARGLRGLKGSRVRLGLSSGREADAVHVKFLLNGIQSNVMWDATIPPNGLWTQNGIVWNFNDPALTYGIRKARVIDYGGGSYLMVFFDGRNQNISLAPVVPGTDNVTAEVEVFDGANQGVCYSGSTTVCNGNGNTQKCKV